MMVQKKRIYPASRANPPGRPGEIDASVATWWPIQIVVRAGAGELGDASNARRIDRSLVGVLVLFIDLFADDKTATCRTQEVRWIPARFTRGTWSLRSPHQETRKCLSSLLGLKIRAVRPPVRSRHRHQLAEIPRDSPFACSGRERQSIVDR